MADSYIPAADGDALTWMTVFAQGIAAAPATYNLLALDATAISNGVAAFQSAYDTAVDPATRTPVAVNAKDVARADAEAICRQYAQVIKYDAGVSDANKIAIGVRPVNDSRTPINVPGTSPLLDITVVTPGRQTLRYADTATPDSRAKPFGAASLQLFCAVGTAAATDPEAAEFKGAYTRNPVQVNFTAADDGKVATYFGRWAARTGEVGPWSLPVSMRIAA